MTATATTTARWERVRLPAYTIGGLALATVALHLRDPHETGSWGLCPSAALFGVYCPGCGGLRAVNDLTNGDVAGALSSNLALVLTMPVAIVLLGVWAVDAWTGRVRVRNTRLVLAVVVPYCLALAAFTVLRNLPAGSWLAP